MTFHDSHSCLLTKTARQARSHPRRHRQQGLGTGQLLLPVQGVKVGRRDQPQRLGRAHLDTGRARLAVLAEIALERLRLGLLA